MQTPRTNFSGETSGLSRPIALTRAGSSSSRSCDKARAAGAPDRRGAPLARPSPTAAQLVRAGLLLAAGLVAFAGLRGGAAGAQEARGPGFAQMVNPDR
jgi:hypothetical protein